MTGFGVALAKDVMVPMRDGIRLATDLYRPARDGEPWSAIDLPTGDLGDWEPTYDVARWGRDGVLSLFVLPVRQGDHERTTAQPPQIATIIEWAAP